ncbi:MAG: hypothetical protein HW380_3438 [Magnetococcales bacterium]|nr:hypothetical protein [Magnetococcales bacterium]
MQDLTPFSIKNDIRDIFQEAENFRFTFPTRGLKP